MAFHEVLAAIAQVLQFLTSDDIAAGLAAAANSFAARTPSIVAADNVCPCPRELPMCQTLTLSKIQFRMFLRDAFFAQECVSSHDVVVLSSLPAPDPAFVRPSHTFFCLLSILPHIFFLFASLCICYFISSPARSTHCARPAAAGTSCSPTSPPQRRWCIAPSCFVFSILYPSVNFIHVAVPIHSYRALPVSFRPCCCERRGFVS